MMKGGIDMWLCKLFGHDYKNMPSLDKGKGYDLGTIQAPCPRCGESISVVTRVVKRPDKSKWPEGSRVLSKEETDRQYGWTNRIQKDKQHVVTWSIDGSMLSPSIYVDGEEMAIVSCDYHYVTRSGEGNPGESILTATVVHHTTDPTQHVVSINQQTGQVFYQ